MRRSIRDLGIAGIVLAAIVGGQLPVVARAASNGAARPPNIVVLMTDDQTAASIPYMPNVSKMLVSRGTRFEDHFVSYPLCCPARATYLTGQYSHNHHVTYNQGLSGGYQSFFGRRRVVPAALQQAGYTTIHIGKYLNGYGLDAPRVVPPGWDDWQATVDPTTYQYHGFTLNQNGRLHRFDRHEYQTNVEARLGALAIRREARARRPFFLDLAFLAPHAVERETSGVDPVDARAAGRSRGRYGIRYPVPERRDRGRFDQVPLPDSGAFDEADVSDKPPGIQVRPELTPREIRVIVRNYHLRLETLMSVDRAVARIVRALHETRHLRDTYIVLVSDNGYFHGQHRIPFGKYLPYEPSIRVPLVVRGPHVRQGAAVEALTSDVDLPATILRLAGARAPRPLDGRSLVPLFRGHRQPRPRSAVLIESGANDVGAPVYSGLRTRHYKYVEYTDGAASCTTCGAIPESSRTSPVQLLCAACSDASRPASPARGRVGVERARDRALPSPSCPTTRSPSSSVPRSPPTSSTTALVPTTPSAG